MTQFSIPVSNILRVVLVGVVAPPVVGGGGQQGGDQGQGHQHHHPGYQEGVQQQQQPPLLGRLGVDQGRRQVNISTPQTTTLYAGTMNLIRYITSVEIDPVRIQTSFLFIALQTKYPSQDCTYLHRYWAISYLRMYVSIPWKLAIPEENKYLTFCDYLRL